MSEPLSTSDQATPNGGEKPPGITSATPGGASILGGNSSSATGDWKTVTRRPGRLENVSEEAEDSSVPPSDRPRIPSLGAGRATATAAAASVARRWPGGVPSLGQGSGPLPPRPVVTGAAGEKDEDEEITEAEYAQLILDKLRNSRTKSTASQGSPLSSSPRRPSGFDALNAPSWRTGVPRPLGTGATFGSSSPGAGRLSTAGPPPGLGSSSPRTPTGFSGSPGSLTVPGGFGGLDRNQRRFSLAPTGGTMGNTPPSGAHAGGGGGGAGTTMKLFGGALAHRGSTAGLPPEAYLALRRHSLAGPAPVPHTASSSAAYRHLSDALDHLQLEDFRRAQYGGLAEEAVDDYFDPEARRKSIADVGRGIPLSQMPPTTPLYIVEFKAGRSDLFYAGDSMAAMVKKGDLVIVEADRGKDLGKIVNDNITPLQVQQLQMQQAELLPELQRNKELHPKSIYRLAQPGEVAMLLTKSQDEVKALQICQTKVRQKKLPMEVVDAEYQWDRRKLTFYFVADRRIDFRELVRELFKIYKTRIWMCAVNPAAATGAVPGISKSPQLAASAGDEME